MVINSTKTLAIALVLSILASHHALAAEKQNISIRSQSQINYSYEIQASISGNSILEQYGFSDDATVFPGIGLACVVTLLNQSKDTLRLAESGQNILQFLRLNYSKNNDPDREVKHFQTQLVPTLDSTVPDSLQNLAEGNILPPHRIIEVQAFPSWDELYSLCPDTLDFFWSFNNSEGVRSDSTITLLREECSRFTVKILPNPLNKADSIYYFNEQAKDLNQKGKLQESYNMSLQVLQMDSMNVTATITAIDILWKMSQFTDALKMAQKEYSLIKEIADYDKMRGAFHGADNDNKYLKKIAFFITKCQNREKWKWAK
ncbi:MAG: hypothetical protein NTW14_08335 [bacterium]|nr:hypothetical protein [bacterium]